MQSEGKFVIQEPCHEDWNAMTPTQQGRFCAACQKCVVDLTRKSPSEIKDIYDENNGDVCGRMRLSQFAEVPARHSDTQPLTSRVLKQLQMFALALLATFSFAMQPAKAQDRPIKGKIARVPANVQIEGQVSWDHGLPARNATVEIFEGDRLLSSTSTDEKGHFEFGSLEHGVYRVVARVDDWTRSQTDVIAWSNQKFKVTLTLEDVAVDGGLGKVPDPEPEMLRGQIVYIPPVEETPASEVPPLEEKVNVSNPVPVKVDTVFDRCGGYFFVNMPEAPAVEVPEPEADPHEVEAEAEAESLTEPETDKQSLEEHAVLDDLELVIFPNPTTDQLTIRLKTPSTRPVHYFLYDMQGRSLAAIKWEPGMAAEQRIHLGRYAAGTYLLRMLYGDALVEKRIVKQ